MSEWPYEQTIRRNISFKGNQFFYSAGLLRINIYSSRLFVFFLQLTIVIK